MTANKPSCPSCLSKRIIKNCCIHNGKQHHRYKNCSRQFVEDPQSKIITQETKELIDKLLLGKMPLTGIARVADVSEPWLQDCVNQRYEVLPKQVQSRLKKGDV